jgi:hypothetical protein
VAGTTVGELLGFLIPVAVIYVASGLVIRAGECAQDVAGLTIPTSPRRRPPACCGSSTRKGVGDLGDGGRGQHGPDVRGHDPTDEEWGD